MYRYEKARDQMQFIDLLNQDGVLPIQTQS